MGFLIGGSCFVPSVPLHSRFLSSPSSSSSSSPSSSQFGLLCSSNVAKFKRRRPTLASLNQEDGYEYDAASAKRRAFLLVGISVLPFLQLRSPALADESEFFYCLDEICSNVAFGYLSFIVVTSSAF